jgi:hypothetical protein
MIRYETVPSKISYQDIMFEWPRFTQVEAAAIKNFEGLKAQVVLTYQLDKAKADMDVRGWMAGRKF